SRGHVVKIRKLCANRVHGVRGRYLPCFCSVSMPSFAQLSAENPMGYERVSLAISITSVSPMFFGFSLRGGSIFHRGGSSGCVGTYSAKDRFPQHLAGKIIDEETASLAGIAAHRAAKA